MSALIARSLARLLLSVLLFLDYSCCGVLTFKMNHFKQAVSEDMLKVSKLVQLRYGSLELPCTCRYVRCVALLIYHHYHRVFSGTIKFINQFNQDGVAFSEKTLHKLKLFIDLLSEAGQAAPARQLHTTLETVCSLACSLSLSLIDGC